MSQYGLTIAHNRILTKDFFDNLFFWELVLEKRVKKGQCGIGKNSCKARYDLTGQKVSSVTMAFKMDGSASG